MCASIKCGNAERTYAGVMATPRGHGAESEAESEIGWGVGSVAARLGIAPSTLRTWERRYDVGPSRRTAGGHRRYTEHDIERVMLTQMLIARGAPPSDAARVAHSLDGPGLASALDSEHAQNEDPTRPAEAVPALLEATLGDDPRRIGRLVADVLRGHGAVRAWTDVIAPSLIRIGTEWAAGRIGIETEHLASEAIGSELRAYTRRLAIDGTGPAIIVASAEDDQHSLPVFALEAALAEAGVGSHVLGARLPTYALADVTARLRPRVIFLWASLARPEGEPIWEVLATLGDETTVILGGPGWPHDIGLGRGLRGALESTDLQSTVDRVLELIGRASAYRR